MCIKRLKKKRRSSWTEDAHAMSYQEVAVALSLNVTSLRPSGAPSDSDYLSGLLVFHSP